MLLDQRVIFLGGEVSGLSSRRVEIFERELKKAAAASESPLSHSHTPLSLSSSPLPRLQVNDFVADAIISQLLLLDAKDAKKVNRERSLELTREREKERESRASSFFFFLSFSPRPRPPSLSLSLFSSQRASPKLTPDSPALHSPDHHHHHQKQKKHQTTKRQDIKLFINSPGGSVTAGLGIYDAMQMTRADVATYCFGLAASMGAFLLCAGATGKRHAMPNARIMIHQPLGGASGQAVDIEIQAKEIMFHKANLNRIMASRTGKSARQIDLDTDRDRYMSALEAKRYGLIDHVIGGDDAGFKITGDLSKLPKTKEEYVAWGKEAAMGDDGSRAQRFKGTVEPFVKPLNPEKK